MEPGGQRPKQVRPYRKDALGTGLVRDIGVDIEVRVVTLRDSVSRNSNRSN